MNGTTPSFPRALRPVGADLVKVSLASEGYKTCGIDANGTTYCALNATDLMAPLHQMDLPWAFRTIAISSNLFCGSAINGTGNNDFVC